MSPTRLQFNFHSKSNWPLTSTDTPYTCPVIGYYVIDNYTTTHNSNTEHKQWYCPRLDCHAVQCSVFSVQCTLYNVHCTNNITMYIVHYTRTLYTVYCTPYTVTYTVHYTQYSVHITPYTVLCTLYTGHYTPYTVPRTQYIVHHTLYTVYYTPYTVHRTQYIVHRTVVLMIIFHRPTSGLQMWNRHLAKRDVITDVLACRLRNYIPRHHAEQPIKTQQT